MENAKPHTSEDAPTQHTGETANPCQLGKHWEHFDGVLQPRGQEQEGWSAQCCRSAGPGGGTLGREEGVTLACHSPRQALSGVEFWGVKPWGWDPPSSMVAGSTTEDKTEDHSSWGSHIGTALTMCIFSPFYFLNE